MRRDSAEIIPPDKKSPLKEDQIKDNHKESFQALDIFIITSSAFVPTASNVIESVTGSEQNLSKQA